MKPLAHHVGMLIAWVTVIVALVGLVIFVTSKTNADVKRIGEILLFCGTMASLFAVGAATFRLFQR